jgi:hypothetical protein
MGTGGTPSLQSPKSGFAFAINERSFTFINGQLLNIDGPAHFEPRTMCASQVCNAFYSAFTVKFYGQAERAISNGQLHALLRFHIRPIDVVVFHGPS